MSASRVSVRVPASSANLGPGFDVLAAALGLHLELEVERTGRFAVETGLAVPRDRANLAVRAFARLHPADGMTFRMRSDIPLAGGLGTSATAIVGGLLAAQRLLGRDGDVEPLAAELEGHPDNVAAAIHGGVVICAGGRVVRLPPPAGLEAVLAVPDAPVRTREARAALPRKVPLRDAVHNVAHAALLVSGLEAGDPERIAAGLRDRLHQPYRAHLYPRSAQLVERAGELGALGATVSGAGPTVLLWARAGEGPAVAARAAAAAEGWARVLQVDFEGRGAEAVVLGGTAD